MVYLYHVSIKSEICWKKYSALITLLKQQTCKIYLALSAFTQCSVNIYYTRCSSRQGAQRHRTLLKFTKFCYSFSAVPFWRVCLFVRCEKFLKWWICDVDVWSFQLEKKRYFTVQMKVFEKTVESAYLRVICAKCAYEPKFFTCQGFVHANVTTCHNLLRDHVSRLHTCKRPYMPYNVTFQRLRGTF